MTILETVLGLPQVLDQKWLTVFDGRVEGKRAQIGKKEDLIQRALLEFVVVYHQGSQLRDALANVCGEAVKMNFICLVKIAQKCTHVNISLWPGCG